MQLILLFPSLTHISLLGTPSISKSISENVRPGRNSCQMENANNVKPVLTSSKPRQLLRTAISVHQMLNASEGTWSVLLLVSGAKLQIHSYSSSASTLERARAPPQTTTTQWVIATLTMRGYCALNASLVSLATPSSSAKSVQICGRTCSSFF